MKYNKNIVVNLLGISLLLPPNFCDERIVHILRVNPRCLERLGGELVLVLPPAISNALTKVTLAAVLEWTIADKFLWSLIAVVEWWDIITCKQSSATDIFGHMSFKYDKNIVVSLLGISLLLSPNFCEEQMVYILRCLERFWWSLIAVVD
ncbi:uncharacterized protein LOC125514486 isoform X2 [Triticum urartu]|uniref:uncharacterized protein LOC125514486 isoform X2 n=1 Tax=Triticum urartu TaxID=4572 RepID=UPI002042C28B|nr:uncharacterized protein LOC125514486 isoform X2 [Triticum urartu]